MCCSRECIIYDENYELQNNVLKFVLVRRETKKETFLEKKGKKTSWVVKLVKLPE